MLTLDLTRLPPAQHNAAVPLERARALFEITKFKCKNKIKMQNSLGNYIFISVYTFMYLQNCNDFKIVTTGSARTLGSTHIPVEQSIASSFLHPSLNQKLHSLAPHGAKLLKVHWQHLLGLSFSRHRLDSSSIQQILD